MIFPFTPSDIAPFQFQPTLDGITYSAVVTWNIYGGRYYINLYTVSNVLVYAMPVIGSPQGSPVNLLPPLNPVTGKAWVSQLYYLEPDAVFVVIP